MTKHYYNTNKLCLEDLALADAKAATQDEIILAAFKKFPNDNFTPFEIHRALFKSNTPVTSVRRSMTTLSNNGELVKTDILRSGDFGKLCHAWRLA